MAASDINVPRYVDLSKLNPPIPFTCDVHGARTIVKQYNPPNSNAANQVPDANRLRCCDCEEETIPNRVRSVG